VSGWRLFIALDPGGTTGVASCWYNGVDVANRYVAELPPHDACTFVWESLRLHGNGVHEVSVVAERFTIGPQTMKMSRQHDALEVIGAVRWMTQRHHAPFELQDPATAKRMVSNVSLKEAGFWSRGSKGHGHDAARHLLVLLVKNGWYYPFVG
jgi:hypothetical protein